MNRTFPHIPSILGAVDEIIGGTGNLEKVLAEITKLLKREVDYYDWVGFYLVDDSQENLVLGPYEGASTDHTKIAFGKGVCGQVAVSEMSCIIQDISQETNYLSCSSNVRSEIVIPIMKNDVFVAELDIDSHALSPFTDQDSELLEAICNKLATLF